MGRFQLVLAAQIGLLLVVAAVIVAFPWMNSVFSGILMVTVSATTGYFVLRKGQGKLALDFSGNTREAEGQPAILENLIDTDSGRPPAGDTGQENVETGLGNNTSATISISRLEYVDNLRALLTGTVIAHHCFCAIGVGGWYLTFGNYHNVLGQVVNSLFLMVNQSYFMSLFFFLAGLFTPGSFRRKRKSGFLQDRFIRLGVPLFFYIILLSPLCQMISARARRETFEWTPEPGPCWFVMWLLMFSVAYAVLQPSELACTSTVSETNSKPWIVKSVSRAICAGSALSIIQTVVIISLSSGFLCMPITIGSLPYDIAFFSAGCVAKQYEWLEEITSKRRNGVLKFNAACIAVLAVSLALNFGAGYNAMDLYKTVAFMVPALFMLGSMCVSLSISAIDLAHRYLNFSTPMLRFFTRSAYTAYVIHAPVVCFLTWTSLLFIEWIEGEPLPSQFFTDQATPLKNEWTLWAAWAFINVFTQLFTWPIAYALTCLPYAKGILY